MDTQYRIAAFDPGTDTLGMGVVGVDLVSREITILYGGTVHSSRCINPSGLAATVFGERYARIQNSHYAVLNLLQSFLPHSVVHEAPYMRKFAEAYRALSECIQTSIREAVYLYDPTMVIGYVDPPTAKLAVGVNLRGPKCKGVTKEDVRVALLAGNWKAAPGVYPEYFDEHTVDACAVGIWKAIEVLNLL